MSLVEGIGDEVLLGLACVVAVTVTIVFAAYLLWKERWFVGIHPDSQEVVANTRRNLPEERRGSLENLEGMVRQRRRNRNDNQCPICLANEAAFAIETNCGHMFCGRCITTYWRHAEWFGPVRCPVCRQQVTVLLQYFTEEELNSAEDAQERAMMQGEIHAYNRRFSGQPRPIMDYIRDLPTLMRHLWTEFFSVGGLMYMFRIRIALCFVAAITYIISPLDIIPEALFGILGLCDDVFVLLLLAVYVSIIYRRFLASREEAAAIHQHRQ